MIIDFTNALKSDYDIDSSSLHSRIFFRASQVFANQGLLDEARQTIAQDGPTPITINSRHVHLANLVIARAHLQRDVGQYFLEHPEIAARKVYGRLKGTIASASQMILKQDESKRMLNGVLRENGVLAAVHGFGYPEAQLGNVNADIFRKEDVISPETEESDRFALQVKPEVNGRYRVVPLSQSLLQVNVGLSLENPSRLVADHTGQLGYDLERFKKNKT